MQASSPDILSVLNNIRGTEDSLLPCYSDACTEQTASHGCTGNNGGQGLPPGYYFVPFANSQTLTTPSTLFYRTNSNNDLYTGYNYNLEHYQQLATAGCPLYVIQDPTTGMNHVFYHFSASNYQLSSKEDQESSSITENFESFVKSSIGDNEVESKTCDDVLDELAVSTPPSLEIGSCEGDAEQDGENHSGKQVNQQQSLNETLTCMATNRAEMKRLDLIEKHSSCFDGQTLEPSQGDKQKMDSRNNCCNNTGSSNNQTDDRIPAKICQTLLSESEKTDLDKPHFETIDDDLNDSLEDYVDTLVSMEEESRLDYKKISQQANDATLRGTTFLKAFSKHRNGTYDIAKAKEDSQDVGSETVKRVKANSNEFLDILIDCDDKSQLEERLRRSQKELQQLNFEEDQPALKTRNVEGRSSIPVKKENAETLSRNTSKLHVSLAEHATSNSEADSEVSMEVPRKRQRLSSLTLDSYTNHSKTEANLDKPIHLCYLSFADSVENATNIKHDIDDAINDAVFDESLDLHSMREAYGKMYNYTMS